MSCIGENAVVCYISILAAMVIAPHCASSMEPLHRPVWEAFNEKMLASAVPQVVPEVFP